MNWYSNHVIPILDFDEMGGIVIAMEGTLYPTYSYDKETNTCRSEEYGEPIRISLADPRIDGWCYMKDLYPKNTKI